MTSRTAEYQALVDWNNDGDFLDTNEDVAAYVLADESVSVSGQGRDHARGIAPPQTSTMEYALNNADRRFSYENTGSVLAGSLLPGRKTQLRALIGTDWLMESSAVLMESPDYLMEGVGSAPVFTGQIDVIDEDPGIGRRLARMTSHGRIGRISLISVVTPLYTQVTTGQAMGYLLAAAGLAASDYSIDSDVISSGRMLSYWFADGRDALALALELWATEGYSAFLGEDEDGVIVFQGRNYRTITSRSQVVQATFRDIETTSDYYHVGFRISPAIRDVINRPYVDQVVPRVLADLAVVWQYDTVITLGPTGGASVTAKPSDPFSGAVAPVAGADFTMSVGTVTVALSRDSGGLTDIVFSGGTAGAQVSALQLRAQALTASGSVTVETGIDTSASKAKYGERAQALAVWPGIALTDAQSLCDGMAIAYQEPRPIIEIDVVNADWPHLLQILARKVGDRIHVVDFQAGADLDATIESKAHRITGGPTHLLTMGLEKVVESDWALYDVDLYGTGLFGL